MSRVRSLLISGFRGMLAPLFLDLTSNGKPVSTLLYGRNGTGKSSITDAWEWLCSGKIEHLSREGAGPGSYAHLAATPGHSFVEGHFADAALGTLRLEMDYERTTKPRPSGAFSVLHSLAPHPCHIRFADLTRFVYLTKSERYDLLAALMGFLPQVEVQKGLRRTQTKFEESTKEQRNRTTVAYMALKARVGSRIDTFAQLSDILALRLGRFGIPAPASPADITTSTHSMRALVQNDPNAILLASLKSIGARIRGISFPVAAATSLRSFLRTATPFKEKEDQLKGLLLIQLYEDGLAALKASGNRTVCPLCQREYGDDLHAHLVAEQGALRALRIEYERTLALMNTARTALTSAVIPLAALQETGQSCPDSERSQTVARLVRKLEDLNRITAALSDKVKMNPRELTTPALGDFATLATTFEFQITSLIKERDVLLKALDNATDTYTANQARVDLVRTFELVAAVAELYPTYVRSLKTLRAYKTIGQELEGHIQDYVASSMADVEGRFRQISDQVATFFGILETDTPGLGKPALHILEDQDRSVVPEVMFHGHLVSPAYKYLSESQLNSFGLAVFLASALHFNPQFHFILLDDVVNSLDGYKRPRLIEILKTYFADKQVLLLTHDSVWRDRIAKELPSWKRLHFKRHDIGTGPVMVAPQTTLDQVEQLILDDEPRRAGQLFGPLMEDDLQDICESFEAEVKYNRRNEYTLEPLVAALRRRVESKLKPDHPFCKSVVDLAAETGFRNLCAHAKNPEVDITPQEMTAVVTKWKVVFLQARCADPACAGLLRWADPDFRCACGKGVLKRT